MLEKLGESIFKGVTDSVLQSQSERAKRDDEYDKRMEHDKQVQGTMKATGASFGQGMQAAASSRMERDRMGMRKADKDDLKESRGMRQGDQGRTKKSRRYYPDMDKPTSGAKSVQKQDDGLEL